MRNGILIGVSVIAILLLFYFGIYRPQKESKKASQNDDNENQNLVKNDFGKSDETVFEEIKVEEKPKGWIISDVFVSNEYPQGSDNVIPAETTYANSDIAKVAYAGDIARAINDASKISFPLSDGTNRTKLLVTLEATESWKSLINKIHQDPRIDGNTKGQLISDINRLAWDGILADVRSNQIKRVRNAIVTAAAIGITLTTAGALAAPLIAANKLIK